MIRRLRVRFVIINMSLVTVLMAVMLAALVWQTQRGMEAASLATMQQIALDPQRVERLDEEFTGARVPYLTVQIAADGIARPVGGGYYDATDDELIQQLAQAALATGETTGLLPDYGLRFLRTGGFAQGEEYLIFADASNEQAAMRRLLVNCLAVGAAAYLLFFVVSVALARWAARPVAAAWQQQKQFVADASHELKTPLTVILTNAELLEDADYSAAEKADFSANILVMARQMRGLIEKLLELARADQAQPPARLGRQPVVDFSAAVTQTLLPFEPLFYEQGLPLQTEVTPGLAVRGDAEALGRVVAVLADNALKYAAPHTTVRVSLQRQHHSALLCVASCGAPLDKAQRQNIFKRFYRADPARRRDGSYGLGLAIAHTTITRHKGRIWAESAEGENRFYVKLPLCGPAGQGTPQAQSS